jgi:acyl dehydratase
LGVDEVRWSATAYPDDSLRNILRAFEVNPPKTKPERGILKLKHKILNQNKLSLAYFNFPELL